MTARRISVTGRVQGVFFRAWTKELADALGISGWVRNCPDGSVEALIDGEPEAIEAMVERMRQGPPSARVDRLAELPADEAPAAGFKIRH